MVSNVDIRFHHFYLVVLQGDMVGFAKAFPVSTREGVVKFWNTLYLVKMYPNIGGKELKVTNL